MDIVERLRGYVAYNTKQSREEDDAMRDAAAEIVRLRGLLMFACRYVEGYAENENNHPQVRDGARSLLADIKAALT
jgi:hypothetical protein